MVLVLQYWNLFRGLSFPSFSFFNSEGGICICICTGYLFVDCFHHINICRQVDIFRSISPTCLLIYFIKYKTHTKKAYCHIDPFCTYTCISNLLFPVFKCSSCDSTRDTRKTKSVDVEMIWIDTEAALRPSLSLGHVARHVLPGCGLTVTSLAHFLSFPFNNTNILQSHVYQN